MPGHRLKRMLRSPELMDKKTEAPKGWPVCGPKAIGGRIELPTKVFKW